MSEARRNPLEILCEVLEKELNKSERRFKRLDADCEKMFSTLGKKTESELSEEDIVKFVKLVLGCVTENLRLKSIQDLVHELTRKKPESVAEALRHYIT